MPYDSKKHRSSHPFRLPPRWRWIFWPVVTLSGGWTTITLWMQEELILLVNCVPVAAIPGLATLLYWFNHRLFKAAIPLPEDLKMQSNCTNLIRKED